MASKDNLRLPLLGPAFTRREEFGLAAALIQEGLRAFAARDESYERRIGDILLRLGLELGKSTATACAMLAMSDPFLCCVCARPYLESSLRLLWAAREQRGGERLYAFYEIKHREFAKKLAERAPEYAAALETMNEQAPVMLAEGSSVPEMRRMMEDIGSRDGHDSVNSLFSEPSVYDEVYAPLHMFSHANPIFLDREADQYLPHAAHAVTFATLAVLRALGYRLGWDQNAIALATCRICSLESLPPEERQQVRSEIQAVERSS